MIIQRIQSGEIERLVSDLREEDKIAGTRFGLSGYVILELERFNHNKAWQTTFKNCCWGYL